MAQYALTTLSKHVVGLQPDDRMPHDWLRMVARVFASYRKRPLEKAIVAYIDGLNVSNEGLVGTSPNVFNIKVTPGQSFIDDQFVGLIEDTFGEINTNYLQTDLRKRYWIVLQYEWINMSPPREPHFMLIYNNFDDPNDSDNAYNDEQMLILGYVVRHVNAGIEDLEVVDEKEPWYREMLAQIQGFTGTIVEVAGTDIPEGYLECNGSTYNITDYPDLFNIIGVTYGDDGPGTFKVPEVTPNPFKKYIKY